MTGGQNDSDDMHAAQDAAMRRLWARIGALILMAVSLVLIAFTLVAPLARPAAAQETTQQSATSGGLITLEAVVRNGTAGASVPEGLIVTLQVFDLENTEQQRLETETGADGGVSFGGVIGDEEVSYTLSAAYNEVRFFSDAFISTIDRDGPIHLTIFEPTSDPSVIRITGDSSAITPPEGDSGVLRILQVTTFENTSDRAFVGNDPLNTRLTVRLPLPVMAFDLESVHSPGSLVLAPDSRDVYSIIPLMPGIEEYIVTYGVLYTTDVLAWSKTYPYPTEIARLLVPEEISFRPGSEWVQMQDSEVSGVTYARYEMRSIIGGETLSGTVADLPLSAGSRSRSLEQTLRDVALGVVAVALIMAAGFALWWGRFRNRRRGLSDSNIDREAVQEQRDAAVAELARLEEAREAGDISEDEYAEASAPHREVLRRILEEERTQ